MGTSTEQTYSKSGGHAGHFENRSCQAKRTTAAEVAVPALESHHGKAGAGYHGALGTQQGKINKQCGKCGGFKDLSEFKHKKKASRMNKICRMCLDRSCKYHMNNLIMIQNRIIAEDNN